jgi:hypothetical protein
MRDLQLRMIVNWSIETASEMLDALLGEHGSLAVRPSFAIARLGIEMVLRPDVLVSTVRLRSDRRWHVAWCPADDGAFPRFDGSLHFAADDASTHTSALMLHGSYALNGLAAADPADRALAHRIEMATARALLGALRGGLEGASLLRAVGT